MVVAFVALLVALGGTSTAQPVRDAAARLLTGSQVKDGSLTGKDVKDRSLTPRDFKGSVKGARGPAGAAGATGPTGPAGVSGVTRVTRLEVSTGSLASPTVDYQELRDVGIFTKAAGSRIKLSWNGRNRGSGTGAWFCDFQLRIDGAEPMGAGGRAVVLAGGGLDNDEPAAAMAYFDGLAAGTHEVSIWVRANPTLTTNCSTADGGFEDEVFVEEMPG
jgi:hypothetical protein